MSSSETATRERVSNALNERADKIADRWVQLQLQRSEAGSGISEAELHEEADAVVGALSASLAGGLPV